ncbi:MAG: response regulator [Gammaproteobacteria bacterium]|nr:response regulator [Gammaproteobacteria bacterium]
MECRRVLVVDDKEDAASSLAALLETGGYETYTEVDGRAALAAAMMLRPEAVLTDLKLPGLTGCDLCRRIRGEPWGGHVLIMAVTGWSRESDRAAAREAGFDHYLLKPVEFETLDTLLRRVERRA